MTLPTRLSPPKSHCPLSRMCLYDICLLCRTANQMCCNRQSVSQSTVSTATHCFVARTFVNCDTQMCRNRKCVAIDKVCRNRTMCVVVDNVKLSSTVSQTWGCVVIPVWGSQSRLSLPSHSRSFKEKIDCSARPLGLRPQSCRCGVEKKKSSLG
jgi:hypothetical protein